jgi:hypothetical protein
MRLIGTTPAISFYYSRRQRRETAEADATGALRRSGQGIIRKLPQEARHSDATFHPRQREADAEMRATGESEVLVGPAGKIEPVRLAELAWIAVGRADSAGTVISFSAGCR